MANTVNFQDILSMKSARALLLLFVSFIFIFILPTFEAVNTWVTLILYSFIIFLATYSISTRMVYIGLAAIILELSTKTTDFIYLHYLAEFATNLTLIVIVGFVIVEIMNRKNVTPFTLIDAINGYLILGIMFISLVGFCDKYVPGSYENISSTDMDIPYYTFITLTTAGYGDVTPLSPIAKSLSMFISVTGQFYVAVIVAIIVGKYSSTIQE